MSLTSITESPGLKATAIQQERLLQRYAFVRSFVTPTSDVLEIACGSGMGLPYLSQRARTVCGTDVDPVNIAQASSVAAEKDRISLCCCDAHRQPYGDASFDVVTLLEALYYLDDPSAHVKEVARVLRPGGRYIIGTVNPAMDGFHPSPHARTYFNAQGLMSLLSPVFSRVELYGGFPEQESATHTWVTACKKTAVRFHLIPGSLAARAYLKRVFIGRLSPLPDVVSDDMAVYHAPERIAEGAHASRYTILYAVATR